MSDTLFVTPEMSLTEAWSIVMNQVKEALAGSGHPFRYATLATVYKKKSPLQRMVVLRDFSNGPEFTIYTDSRSNKVQQINKNESVSLLFYHNLKRLQLRVTGCATIVNSGEEYMQNWNNDGQKNPCSYTSVIPPGTKIRNPEEAFHWNMESKPNFCLIKIKVTYMEFLQLDGVKHIRAEKIVRDNNEITSWIAP